MSQYQQREKKENNNLGGLWPGEFTQKGKPKVGMRVNKQRMLVALEALEENESGNVYFICLKNDKKVAGDKQPSYTIMPPLPPRNNEGSPPPSYTKKPQVESTSKYKNDFDMDSF